MKTKMIKNAISMVLALLVFTTIGLTACSTNKQNKVIIWAWDAYANAAEKAVELYKGIHPDSKQEFEVVVLGQDDMVEKVKVALATGATDTLPDIFYDEDYNFAEYLTYYEKYFFDLSSYVNLEDYYDYKTINAIHNGKTYSIPYESGTGALFYRYDLIQQAGYDAEDLENITWDEFIEIGKDVKGKTGVDMLIMCPDGDMEGRLMYQAAGTWFYDASGTPNISDNAAFRDTFLTMKDIYDADIVYDALGWDDYISAIANQKIVSLFGATWWAPIISEYTEQSGKWRVTTMPRIAGSEQYTNYSSLGGGAWFVVKNDHSQIAAEFCKESFGNSVELANYMAKNFFVLPTNKKVVAELATEGSVFWGGQDIAACISNSNEHIPAVKYGLNTYEITYTVGPLAGQYLKGEITLDSALNQMQMAAINIIK